MTADKEPLHDPPKRKSSGCDAYCCYKTFVVLYGLFFFIVGVILLSVGIWVESIRRDYSSINDVLRSPTIMAISVGIIMICVAFCAIIGALKENICLVKIFLAILIIVFILQVVIGIIAYVYKEQSIKVANKQLNLAINEYHNNEKIAQGVDKIQNKWSCCGLESPSDWNKNEMYACGAENSTLACGVPDSCCRDDAEEVDCGLGVRHGSVTETDRKLRINTTGCTWYFYMWVEGNLDTVGATALGFAIAHVLGIFLVYMFITYVEDTVNLFTYSKRSYQA